MKHRILISAFSCLPNRGSEPGIGWNWALEAAKTQEVYVLTRTKCKDKIEKELLLNPVSNLHFLYCDSNPKLRNVSIYLEYIHWQWEAYLFLKKILKKESFDYLIHLTFGSMFLPLWTYKLDIPFIWGPLGGGERVPSFMHSRFTLKNRIPHIVKNILIKTTQITPFILKPAEKAILIIAKTNDTKKAFPTKFHDKIEIKLETCINSNEVKIFETKPNSKLNDMDINLVYTGRLIPLKNLEMLIDAFKSIVVNNPLVKLHIIGDGNQREYLQSKVNSLNIQNNVIFYGMLPREDALRIVGESDIYVFPSLKEGGAWSLMEAMALGKPVVCLKLSGMEIITDNNSAIRIEGTNYSDMVDNFTKSISSLINNPDLRRNMGENAAQRMTDFFSWDCIGKFIEIKLDELDKTTTI